MTLRVFGVDPGLSRCGVAVVDGPPTRPVAVAGTHVSTDRDLPVARRLAALHENLAALLDQHRPDVVACERVLFSANARTAMAVGQAAGVALLAAAQAAVPVASYSPNDVKLAVAGHGGADKDAVARMVTAQLGLAQTPSPSDVSDAFAVALCHLARSRISAATGPSTTAGSQLAAAMAEAGKDRGGWESVLDRPHVREAGGTSRDSSSDSGSRPVPKREGRP